MPADQGIFSLATFVTSVIVARSLDVQNYGTFALLFTIATLAVGLQRSAVSEPRLVLAPDLRANGTLGRTLARGLLTSAEIGAVISVAFVAFAMLTRTPTLIALGGVLLLGPFIQDSCRFIMLIAHKPHTMLWLDVVSSSTQIALLLALNAVGASTYQPYLLAWGVGALGGPLVFSPAIAVAIATCNSTELPQRKEVRRLGVLFGGDYLLGIVTLQGTLVAASLVSGLAAAAALRGSDTLVGPFRVLMQTTPALVLGKWTLTGSKSVVSAVIRASLLLWIVAGGWTALLLLVPNVGHMLMGASWAVVRPILPIVLAALFPVVLSYMSSVGLKAIRAGKSLLIARSVLLPVGLAAGIGGATLDGAEGGAIGSLLTSVLAAVLWLATLARQEKQLRKEAINWAEPS